MIIMVVLGPIIFGLILGLVLGSQIRSNDNLTISSFIVILIVGFIMAWQLGQFPFYNDLSFSSGFLSALIGILIGKLLFAPRSAS